MRKGHLISLGLFQHHVFSRYCLIPAGASSPVLSLTWIREEAEAATQVPVQGRSRTCCFLEGRQNTRQLSPLSTSIFWYYGGVKGCQCFGFGK